MANVCAAIAFAPRGQEDEFLRFVPRLLNLYPKILLVIPENANPSFLRGLGEWPDRLFAEPAAPYPKKASWRKKLLEMAAEHECEFIHYCDGDRLMHWSVNFPGELEETVARIPRYDYLIVGRTGRAFASHPLCMQSTEKLINKVVSLVLGRDVDAVAGSRALSSRAIQAILGGTATPEDPATDAEWPVIISRFPGLKLGFIRVEGLEWETPDRHAREVAMAGGVDAWRKQFDRSPENWLLRINLAATVAEGALLRRDNAGPP